MTMVSPVCAMRILRSAVGFVTPSHGSTPRATRSSKLKSPGSVLSNQMATRAVYAQLPGLKLSGCERRRIAGRERLLRRLGHPVDLRGLARLWRGTGGHADAARRHALRLRQTQAQHPVVHAR